jgi:hypothetical protein
MLAEGEDSGVRQPRPEGPQSGLDRKITDDEDAENTRHVVIAGDRYRASGTGGWKADTTVSAQDPDGVTRFATAITVTQRTAPHTFKGSPFGHDHQAGLAATPFS